MPSLPTLRDLTAHADEQVHGLAMHLPATTTTTADGAPAVPLPLTVAVEARLAAAAHELCGAVLLCAVYPHGAARDGGQPAMAGPAWNIPMRVVMQRGIFIRIFVSLPPERVGCGVASGCFAFYSEPLAQAKPTTICMQLTKTFGNATFCLYPIFPFKRSTILDHGGMLPQYV